MKHLPALVVFFILGLNAQIAAATCATYLNGEAVFDLLYKLSRVDFGRHDVRLQLKTASNVLGKDRNSLIETLLATHGIPHHNFYFHLVNDAEMKRLHYPLLVVWPLLARVDAEIKPRPEVRISERSDPQTDGIITEDMRQILKMRQDEFWTEALRLQASIIPAPAIFPNALNRFDRSYLDISKATAQPQATTWRIDDGPGRALEVAFDNSAAAIATLRYRELFARLCDALDFTVGAVFRVDVEPGLIALEVIAPSTGRPATPAEVQRALDQSPKLGARLKLLEALTGVNLYVEDLWLVGVGLVQTLGISVENIDRIARGMIQPTRAAEPVDLTALSPDARDTYRRQVRQAMLINPQYGNAISEAEFKLILARAAAVGL